MRCCNSDAQAREIHMPYSELPFPYCSTAAEATLAAVLAQTTVVILRKLPQKQVLGGAWQQTVSVRWPVSVR